MTELTRHLIRQAARRRMARDPPCYGTLPSGDRLFSYGSAGHYKAIQHSVIGLQKTNQTTEMKMPRVFHLRAAGNGRLH